MHFTELGLVLKGRRVDDKRDCIADACCSKQLRASVGVTCDACHACVACSSNQCSKVSDVKIPFLVKNHQVGILCLYI